MRFEITNFFKQYCVRVILAISNDSEKKISQRKACSLLPFSIKIKSLS